MNGLSVKHLLGIKYITKEDIARMSDDREAEQRASRKRDEEEENA